MVRHISQLQRIHVMNYDVPEDLATLNPEIATDIARDDHLPYPTPLTGRIELLVQPSFVSKGCDTDVRLLPQIAIAFLERRDSDELRVRPRHSSITSSS
jgi:hypothetical protein